MTKVYLTFGFQVLAFGNPLIAYEVVLTIQRLVNKFGKDLIHMAWETILDILLKLLHQSEVSSLLDVSPLCLFAHYYNMFSWLSFSGSESVSDNYGNVKY